MYPYCFRKKSFGESGTVLIEDCFAEKAKNLLWILGIIVVLVIVFSIVKFSGQLNPSSGDTQAGKNISPVKNIVFTPCPYCRGMLDLQGRCNIPECLLYDPGWGMGSGQWQPSEGRRLSARPWCLNR